MATKKIESLTPEQESQIQVYLDKYINNVNSGHYRTVYKRDTVEKLINWQYQYSGFEKPMTILANNPYEAQLINQLLTDNYLSEIDTYYTSKDEDEKERCYTVVQDLIANYLAKDAATDRIKNHADNYIFTSDVYTNILLGWWGYLIDVLKLESTVNDVFLNWRELYENAGVYNAICNEKVCITSNYPLEIHRNEAGDLHNTSDVAVKWSGVEWKCYYINGRNISAKDFEMALNGEVTRDIYNAEANQDTRAAWYEILGQERMMQILDVEEIDRGTFVHNDGSVEEVILLKTKQSYPETGDNPYAWVRFVCPSTGTNYLIDVEPHHTSAVEAAVSTSPLVTSVDDYKFDDRA
jgi:hypothetical protein